MKYYTGVGSRDTPLDVFELMEHIASRLACDGWVVRSGSAQGADTAFENGAMQHAWEHAPSITDIAILGQLYIPWDGFTKVKPDYKDWYKVLDRMPKRKEAEAIAQQIHPAWDRCSVAAKKLHTRNVFQVLGPNLNDPSKFLICWAKLDKHKNIKGGTATAWNIAKKYNVPCFNLYNEEDKQRLINFVDGNI